LQANRGPTAGVPGAIGGSEFGTPAAGNEQKHGVAALDRAQLPGSLKGHADAHAVVKKTEWHFHERLEYMLQLLDVNGGS